jgi:hypothetical protein
MQFSRTYVAIIAILSIILIVSYPLILAGKTEALWGPIQGNFRMVYYISIALVLLGFVPFSIELLRRSDFTASQNFILFGALLTLILTSWLWIILAKAYAMDGRRPGLLRTAIILTLLLVSLSILILYQEIQSKSNWVYLGLGYAFFHTFFLDFILWAYLVL